MIDEHAVLTITEGREEEFERAFADAPAIFAQAAGCHGVELRRSIEDRRRYLVVVHWESVEAHTVGFREGPLFATWRALVGPFFAQAPVVEHFEAPSGGTA